VRQAGGLHVIGTNAMNRDGWNNQLAWPPPAARGPGSTRFLPSAGDNLLRIFGGDRVAGLMNAFRVDKRTCRFEFGHASPARSREHRKRSKPNYYDIRKQVFESTK